ncbi:hypothetical protein ACFO3I_04835 [Rheinheimera marina]|uniref:Uncharacterized protein n=1 Tax=Rheinheimera marina TaxID=1774958 RepID=A0ABV9JIN4_9GAMM
MIGSFNVECPGCGVLLTEDNAGGYRCYCATCVDAIPQMPQAHAGTGFQLVGQYPHFSWQPVIELPAAKRGQA